MSGRVTFALHRTLQAALAQIRGAWNRPGAARSAFVRYFSFLVAVSIGVSLTLVYNYLRFGSYLENGKMKTIAAHAYPLFGNPLAGFLTLMISPGKSIFLYSPPLLLGVLGMRFFWRQHREIAFAVVMATLLLVSFLSCICFVGGDWCWGPRYLAVLLPLWALSVPFIPLNRVRRDLVVMVIGLGLVVQIMALSVENQRFFMEKGFRDYFWAEDGWVYFKHSALFDRVGEMASLRHGLPPTARLFNSIPITEWYTYSLLGPPPGSDRSLAPLWIRNFKIYFLPRPWPLWMTYVPPPLRPVDLEAWLAGLLTIIACGAGFIHRGFQRKECQSQ
jgi:hypothetical protein